MAHLKSFPNNPNNTIWCEITTDENKVGHNYKWLQRGLNEFQLLLHSSLVGCLFIQFVAIKSLRLYISWQKQVQPWPKNLFNFIYCKRGKSCRNKAIKAVEAIIKSVQLFHWKNLYNVHENVL